MAPKRLLKIGTIATVVVFLFLGFVGFSREVTSRQALAKQPMKSMPSLHLLRIGRLYLVEQPYDGLDDIS